MAMDLDALMYPPITRARFEACRTDGRARRICFQTTHAGEPKRSKPPYVGTFNVPFFDTVGRAFESDCGVRLFENKNPTGGYWRSIQDAAEFERIEAWVKRQGSRVFLRDCLEMSLALGMNIAQSEEGLEGHTRLGALEARAKAAPDEEAIAELVAAFTDTIRDLPGYRKAKLIAAVPPRPGKQYDLPSVLAARVAVAQSLIDVTARFHFAQPKGTVKEARVEEKWAAWEQSGLTFSPALSDRPGVIVIDDKYQSGISIQFVASVLRAAGAGEICGICAVKTLRDTDNA
jgi:hypothetical protein